jgi:predicted MFS family arabinose efflux permease
LARAFLLVVPLAVVTFAWMWHSLPTLAPPRDSAARRRVLTRPKVALGLLAAVAVHGAICRLHLFSAVPGAGNRRVGLHAFGDAARIGPCGLVGNALVGRAVAASLRGALLAMPVAMALIALGLVAWGRVPLATGGLLAVGRDRHGRPGCLVDLACPCSAG